MNTEISERVIRKVAWRLIPILMFSYLVAYIDRVNVGFAAVTLRQDFGLSNTMFGFGAGLFYFGYFVFDVPANLTLEKVGARRWMSSIMIIWGLMAAATVFVQGPDSFYLVRFLLGVAEAGYFPGVIYLIVMWFPRNYRTRAMALFCIGVPLASVIGSPLSSALLGMDGLFHLPGWQWMFLLEGLPAVLTGVFLLFTLPDGPADAPWLSPEEKEWLTGALAAGSDRPAPSRLIETLRSFFAPRVIAMALCDFANITASLGVSLFLPQIIASGGASRMQTGFLTAVPAAAGLAGLYFVSKGAARFGERAMVILALAITMAGLLIAAAFGAGGASVIGIAALGFAGLGIYGLKAPFWSMIPRLVPASAMTGSIAWINCVGNLGGWFGPSLVGWMSDDWGGYRTGMYGLAATQLIALLLVLAVRPNPHPPERFPLRAPGDKIS